MSRNQATAWKDGFSSGSNVKAANRVASYFSISNVLLLAAFVILTGYGYLVFHAGTQLLPALNPDQDRVERINEIMADADTDPASINQDEIDELLPDWMRVIAAGSSDGFTYGSDGIIESEAHYHSMSVVKRNVLSTHMMLGMVLMITGILQFLPIVRRKYRKFHRISGRIFFASAVVSMSMSAYHLLTTDIEDVYTDFVFFTGLWVLLVWTIGSIAVSIWALVKKQYALHVGWAAMAFSALLSAPLQRGNWLTLGSFASDRTFNEMNIMVTPSLFLQCALVGYFLFCVNRSRSHLKAGANGAPANWAVPTSWGRAALIIAAIAASVFGFVFLVSDAGMVASGYASGLMPMSAIEWHDKAFANASPVILWIATSVSLFTCVKLLLADAEALSQSKKLSTLAVVSGLVSATTFVIWGYQLGFPSWETVMAGSFYLATGVAFAAFQLVFAWHLLRQKQNPAKAREALWFLFGLAMTPALLYLSMVAISYSELVPIAFRDTGDGYQLASAVALTVPAFMGFVAAIHSAETRRHAIN